MFEIRGCGVKVELNHAEDDVQLLNCHHECCHGILHNVMPPLALARLSQLFMKLLSAMQADVY